MQRQAALTKNICSLKEISEKQVREYQPRTAVITPWSRFSDETFQIIYSAISLLQWGRCKDMASSCCKMKP